MANTRLVPQRGAIPTAIGFTLLGLLAAPPTRADTIPNDAPGFMEWCTKNGMGQKGIYQPWAGQTDTQDCSGIIIVQTKTISALSGMCQRYEEATGGRSATRDSMRSEINRIMDWMRTHPAECQGTVEAAIRAALFAVYACSWDGVLRRP
jgi:hypothetical protein